MSTSQIDWLWPSVAWQTGGFHRHDPMIGTDTEVWSFFTPEGICGCGRGCSFWASLFPPLPPGLEWPPEPGEERCLQDPLPRPERRPFRTTGYFGRSTTAWRLSTLTPPRPPWANYSRIAPEPEPEEE